MCLTTVGLYAHCLILELQRYNGMATRTLFPIPHVGKNTRPPQFDRSGRIVNYVPINQLELFDDSFNRRASMFWARYTKKLWKQKINR